MVSDTWRAVALVGSTLASTEVKLMLRAGRATTTSTVAVTAATLPGRRMTALESRYQKPEVTASSACSLPRLRKPGAPLLMRRPSTASTAGRTIRAMPAAIRATITPARPIENRKRCGKTISPARAAATVTALKSTLRPAVWSVRVSASRPGPRAAISSR